MRMQGDPLNKKVISNTDSRAMTLNPSSILDSVINKYETQNYSFNGNVGKIVRIANEYAAKVAKGLKIDKYRKVTSTIIQDLLSPIKKSPVHIIMRHGLQKMSLSVMHIKGDSKKAALQKIEMMRKTENMNNPMEKASFVELMGLIVVLDALRQIGGRDIRVLTSENQRAAQAAKGIGVFFGIKVEQMSDLTCVNYPSDKTDFLLSRLPGGKLPWEKNVVDEIIGKDTYETINNNMKNLLKLPIENITIYITHTQQINAVCAAEKLSVKRLGCFGFILIPTKNELSPQLYCNGVF